MILLIDNYDSFVYNLARYVELCDEQIFVVRNDEIDLAEISQLSPSKIILSPGPGAPDSAGITLEVVKQFCTQIPILGVCLGHQAIAQAFGAEISVAKHPMHGMASWVTHDNTGVLAGLPNPLQVGRYHSLIVKDIPKQSSLMVVAKSEESEIMAIQHKVYPLYGVQFHPESVLTIDGITIIRNFLSSN